MIRAISPIFVMLFLTGCSVTTGSTPEAVCNALIGPIKYNSTNPQSARHAGKVLAVDLAARNQVGVNLRCAKYR